MKTGRPKLAEKEKKAAIVAIRLNSDDRILLEKAAMLKRQDLSKWMRDVLIVSAESQVQENGF